MSHKRNFGAPSLLLGLFLLPLALFAVTPMEISQAVQDEVKLMDTDADGKVSAAEHAAGVRKMFQGMDTDRDKKVTVAEMDAASKAKAEKQGATAPANQKSSAEKIAVIDTNKDGILSLEEHEAGGQKMFTKQDTNADGALTPAELQAGHDAMLKKGS